MGTFLAYEAHTCDLLDWLGVMVFLVGIGLAAAVAPALGAARPDPLTAPRYEESPLAHRDGCRTCR